MLFQRTGNTTLARCLRMWNGFTILENIVCDFPGETGLKQGNVLAYMRSAVMAGVDLALAIVAIVDVYELIQR